MYIKQSVYEILYGHEDGNFYTALKLPYAGKSEAFICYPNGFKIPAWLIWGDEWRVV